MLRSPLLRNCRQQARGSSRPEYRLVLWVRGLQLLWESLQLLQRRLLRQSRRCPSGLLRSCWLSWMS